jgi:hypothetical protein
MFRSLNDIREDLAEAFKTKNRSACVRVSAELKAFEDFWSEVESFSHESPGLSKLVRMRSYFETDSITEADAEFLSQYFVELAEEAKLSADADEGVRMIKDFFRVEEGRPLERTVTLANSGPVSERFVYEEPVQFEDDFWIDSDECPWLNSFDSLLWSDYGLAMFYSARMSSVTIINLGKTIQWVTRSQVLSLSEGLYRSIMLPIEFLRFRDNWMLPRKAKMAA